MFKFKTVTWAICKRGSNFEELLNWANEAIRNLGLTNPQLYYTEEDGGALSVAYETTESAFKKICERFNLTIDQTRSGVHFLVSK